MKNIFWIFLLFSTLAFADFKHKSDKNLEAFFQDYILNPAKQDVKEGQKFGPFKKEVWEEIKASPLKRRYFVTGMARVYLNENLLPYYPKLEKKFGKIDDEKGKKIWGLIVESVYAEKDDAIEKMTNDNALRVQTYKKKIEQVLALKKL